MTAEPPTCPTCGGAVRVVSSDEGTSHYEPVGDPRQAALDALRRTLGRARTDGLIDYLDAHPEAAAALRAYLNTAALPPGTRLILVAVELLDQLGTRTGRGERITAEWGDPRRGGWYEPTFTIHPDDRLAGDDLGTAWAEAEAALSTGWGVTSLLRDNPGWHVEAARPGLFGPWIAANGPTPTAALRALTARLKEAERD